MWTLVITCTALNAICFSEPTPTVKRDFATQADCDRALIALAQRWHPQGGWKMNCVLRRDA